MATNTLPIVGSFYGPQRGSPSPALVNCLAIGTPLFLIAEPDNPADPNAIAVYVESENLTPQMQNYLEENLGAFGFTLEQILAQDAWHLGYIPKQMAAKLTEQGFLGSAPYPVTFSTGTNGGPRVRSTEPFNV